MPQFAFGGNKKIDYSWLLSIAPIAGVLLLGANEIMEFVFFGVNQKGCFDSHSESWGREPTTVRKSLIDKS